MYAFQGFFNPELLKGEDLKHAAYHEGKPILVKEFRDAFDECLNVIDFISQWLNLKTITISLQEYLGLPAKLKDALRIYHREKSDFNASDKTQSA